jgi:hypothetical protein
MPMDIEFITANDKPALLGLSTPELQETAKNALEQLGYKVHTAVNHGEFLHKFAQVPYQVVILEELFSAANPAENESLRTLQRMPMNLRRQSTIILFGFNMATFNPMQAYQQCAHAVVNPSEMFLLIQLIQKAVADSDMFLHTFRDIQRRSA